MGFKQFFTESAFNTRYSIEVNFRTNTNEVDQSFAKLALGYVSAAFKNNKYHVKQIFDENPIRILVSTRNWDDGEYVGVVSWNSSHKCFMISKGFYNRDRKTVSIQNTQKCSGNSASEVYKNFLNFMHNLRKEPVEHKEKLKPIYKKRGPK